jgi:hypothetical protein
MVTVFRGLPGHLVAGTISSLRHLRPVLLMTVFTLSWGTTALGFTRDRFLSSSCLASSASRVTIPISAVIAERGRRSTMIWVTMGLRSSGS